jgi:hypothetical protein
MRLREQIAALRGARILVYRIDMSLILRAVRLALCSARSHIQYLWA